MQANQKNNRIIFGVIGVILAVLGVLFSFRVTNNNILYTITIIMIILGIILVAKSLTE